MSGTKTGKLAPVRWRDWKKGRQGDVQMAGRPPNGTFWGQCW